MTVTVAESRPPKGAGEYERMDVPHEETFGILRTFDETGDRKQALLDTLYTLQALDLAAEDDIVEHVWFQIPSKTDLSDTWVELWVAFKGARVPRGNPARKNPPSVVKTARDERLWEAAKASWEEHKPTAQAGKWAYIMATFQRMKNRTGGGPRKNPHAEVAIPRSIPMSKVRRPFNDEAFDQIVNALRHAAKSLGLPENSLQYVQWDAKTRVMTVVQAGPRNNPEQCNNVKVGCILERGHAGRCSRSCPCLDGKRCPMRKSMTYGVLPRKADFQKHFAAHVPDGEFNIEVKGKHSPLVSSGEYSEDGLWHLVKQLVKGYEKGDEDAGDWASGILGSLGFEWI